jgi:hypothetical protein
MKHLGMLLRKKLQCAIKIESGLTIQLERHRTSAARDYVQNTNDPNDCLCYDIFHGYQSTSNMLPFFYIFPENEKETKKYLDYLNGYVSQILDHTQYKIHRNFRNFILYL